MSQRLPQSSRIRESSKIREILTTGRKYIGNYLILYCLPSSKAHLCAGFLSPKRIGKANRRNRVRRLMREAFRHHSAKMNGSHEILLMGRTSAIDATYLALHDDFLQLCQKARLLPSRDS